MNAVRILPLFAIVVALIACSGGPVTPEGVGGTDAMLSATAVAQKCEEAAKDHDRPFVVEWDATDLASMEAKAARDTLVVKYEGCELTILHQCSDPVAAGKLGAYGTPQFTSGTTQSFDIKNEGELYTKLPLGAANLSSRVSAGEELSLTYHVTGVAMSSREALYEDELVAYPGCEGATHFVWAYNLGAFELSSAERLAAEGEVSGGLGVAGAGGKASTERAAVSKGGSLASCEEQDQRGCRVPIRLVLRPINAGKNPIATAPASTANPEAGPSGANVEAGSAEAQAKEHWEHAKALYEKGDGTGCVASMDKAASLDLRLIDDNDFKANRAICLMAAGKCDDGKKEYRAALAAADVKRELADFRLDRMVRDKSNKVCPAATATDHADFLTRARREMNAAAKVNDAKTCQKLAKAVVKHHKALLEEGVDGKPDFDVRGRAISDAGNTYDPAAVCVAKGTKSCKKGEKVLALQCETVKGDFCKKAVKANWKATIDRLKIDCR